jgi:hypothetical protein
MDRRSCRGLVPRPPSSTPRTRSARRSKPDGSTIRGQHWPSSKPRCAAARSALSTSTRGQPLRLGKSSHPTRNPNPTRHPRLSRSCLRSLSLLGEGGVFRRVDDPVEADGGVADGGGRPHDQQVQQAIMVDLRRVHRDGPAGDGLRRVCTLLVGPPRCWIASCGSCVPSRNDAPCSPSAHVNRG